MKNLMTKFVIACICCITVSVATAGVGFSTPGDMTTTKMMNSLVTNYKNWNDYATVWAKGNIANQTNMLSATETALNKIYKNRDKNIATEKIVKACIAAIEATGCLSCQSRPVGVEPTYLVNAAGKTGKTNITWWIEWDKQHDPIIPPPISRKANR